MDRLVDTKKVSVPGGFRLPKSNTSEAMHRVAGSNPGVNAYPYPQQE